MYSTTRRKLVVLGALMTAGLLFGGTTPVLAAEPEPDSSAAAELVDHYLFRADIDEFLAAKKARDHSETLDWRDDGCSVPGNPLWADRPGGFNFWEACVRHDFGYRNYKKQERFTEDNRHRIDKNFLRDMNAECNKSRGFWAWRGVECRQYADRYYRAVRQFG
jgi:hypothetical protein